MSDEEILNASVKRASEKAKETRAARVLEKGPLMFLAAISVGAGLVTKGNLSDKVAQTAKGLLATAAVVSSSKIVDDISERIKYKKPPKTQNNKTLIKETAAKTVATAGVAGALVAGASILVGVMKGKFTPSFESVVARIENVKKGLDISKAGVQVSKLNALKEAFSLNHPKLVKLVDGVVAALPVGAVTAAEIIANDKYETVRFDESGKNAKKLFLCREFARGIVDKNAAC